MQTVIDGLTGSGKSWFQTHLLRQDWKSGNTIYANYNINFSEDNEGVHRFYTVDETYRLKKAVLAFDEMQDFAGHWFTMPPSFRQRIAHARHNGLDVYATTQDFNDLHVEVRRNTHDRYRCQSILRFPRKDSVKPLFQVITVTYKRRVVKADTDDIRFAKVGRVKLYFISRLWTHEYYDTHADIDFNRFICKVKYEKKPHQRKGEWRVKIYSRDLVARGKARL